MLETLRNDGYTVSARQISKLRTDAGLIMRIPGGAEFANRNKSATGETTERPAEEPASPSPPIPIEIQIARQAQKARLWQESADRMKNRSRRRRTKEYQGLPPDAGLPPRFPSELTLEESRGLLRLDKTMYAEIRGIFKEICQAYNVVRKAGCSPGLWPSVKEELINRSPHLQSIFRIPEAASYDPNAQPMALDIICMDTTKAMRTAAGNITLIDAKNILSLTPDESRDVRGVFDDILKANYYTSKRDFTKEQWDNCKNSWIQQSPRLQEVFGSITSEGDWHHKQKALEIIARDVQKRRRDIDSKRDPNASNKRKAEQARTSTPKKQKTQKEKAKKTPKAKEKEPPTQDPDWRSPSGRPPWMPPTPPPQPQQDPSAFQANNNLDSLAQAAHAQIDPDLLLAAALPDPASYLPQDANQNGQYTQYPAYPAQQQPQQNQPNQNQAPQQYQPHMQSSASPQPSSSRRPSTHGNGTATPIYIRLSPHTITRYPNLPRVWFDQLSEPYTLIGLKSVLGRKISKVQVRRIEGLAGGEGAVGSRGSGGEGGEGQEGAEWGGGEDAGSSAGMRWAVDDDDEVEAYVNYVKEQGGKVTFVVDVV